MNQIPVKFIHLREVDIYRNGAIDNRGGATVAYTEQGTAFEFAVARCSWQDNFNRALGRTKAAGRLASPRYRNTWSGGSRTDFLNVVRARWAAGELL